MNDKMKVLPMVSEVFSRDLFLSVRENKELFVENYKGLMLCQSDYIMIRGKHSILHIKGKELCIKYFNNDDMEICGIVQSIQYTGEDENL